MFNVSTIKTISSNLITTQIKKLAYDDNYQIKA